MADQSYNIMINGYTSPMVCRDPCLTGLPHTYVDDSTRPLVCNQFKTIRGPFRSSTGFGLRTDPVPSLHGRSTPVVTSLHLTPTPTTLRSTGLVGPQILLYSLRGYPSASIWSRHGWQPTGSNLTMPRPRCYGVPHHAGSIKSRPTRSASATPTSYRLSR